MIKKILIIGTTLMASSIWAERIMICESISVTPGAYYKFEFNYPFFYDKEEYADELKFNDIGLFTEKNPKGKLVSGDFAYSITPKWVKGEIFYVLLRIEHKSGFIELFRFDPKTMKGILSHSTEGFAPEVYRMGSKRSICEYK